jgi:hypothetical protein
MTSAHPRGLALKAEHDLAIARLGFHHHEAFDLVCFHPPVAAFRTTLPDSIPNAVRIRFDEDHYPAAEETAAALEQAEAFRALAHGLLLPAIMATEMS